MKDLDALDRKILFALDGNSRQSMSQLARSLKQGRDRIEYRVERLVDIGIIREFTTLVNIYRLGLTIYKIYVRLANDKARVRDFGTALRTHPRVYRVAFYDGSWDINIAMAARSPREFYETHTELLSRFHDLVLDYALYVLVDVWSFQKSYFTGKAGARFLNGGPPAWLNLDSVEYDILKLIAANSRMPVSEIADRLRTTPAVVAHRLGQLEERGIIGGYRISIDHEKVGMLYFKAQLFLRDAQTTHRSELFEYCARNPHITYFISQLGECSLELELEVPTLGEYHAIINDIRERFAGVIQNFRSMLISGEQFNFVPKDLVFSVAPGLD